MNTKVQNKANFLVQRHQTVAKRSNVWHGARRFKKHIASLGYIMPSTLPRTRVKFSNRAFVVAGPEAWNSLPVDIRSSKTVTAFKSRL